MPEKFDADILSYGTEYVTMELTIPDGINSERWLPSKRKKKSERG